MDCPLLDRPVQLDPAMWETVVLNLVSNAFKHTFTGAITVALRQRPSHVELSVTDTGVGIPDADIPHLFTRFHRIEGVRARSHEGAGIGLALVRQIVGLHHGSVRVRSVPGAGSTFTVWVPYNQPRHPHSPPRAPAPGVASTARLSRQAYADEAQLWLDGDVVPAAVLDEPPPQPAPAGRRPVVLVVDDNPDMRRYLHRLLSDRYQIRTADTGQGLDTLASPPADLILADVITHPGGLQLLHRIRANPALQATPVILLTARGDATSALQAIAASAQDYIVKPFSARELIARIGAQLELARLNGEALRDRTGELERRVSERAAAAARPGRTVPGAGEGIRAHRVDHRRRRPSRGRLAQLAGVHRAKPAAVARPRMARSGPPR